MATQKLTLSILHNDPCRFFDTTEAAEIYGKSKAWFERHRWAGTGPRFLKIGRTPMYKAADLLNFIDSTYTADRHSDSNVA